MDVVSNLKVRPSGDYCHYLATFPYENTQTIIKTGRASQTNENNVPNEKRWGETASRSQKCTLK